MSEKKSKRGRPKKTAKRTSRPIRISNELADELNELKGSLTYDQLIHRLKDLYNTYEDNPMMYLSHGELFDDIRDARGHACLVAAQAEEIPVMPTIYLQIGQDVG